MGLTKKCTPNLESACGGSNKEFYQFKNKTELQCSAKVATNPVENLLLYFVRFAGYKID